MEQRKKVTSVIILWSIAVLLLSVSINVSGQTKLEGSVKSLHLMKGSYQLTGKLYVSDSLVVDPGVTIVFHDNTNITLSGYGSFRGSSFEKINLIGAESAFAEGLIIKGQSNSTLIFSQVHFEKLVTPIHLSNDWYRSEVKIQSCEFVKNTTSNTTLLNILNPFVSADLVIKNAKITISENVFAHNLSPIYFEDFNSPGLTIQIRNNAFCENYIRGNGFYSLNTNVLYGRLDDSISNHFPIIENNVFINNYLYDLDADTLAHSANIGIYGSKDSLLIRNNYLEDQIGIYDNRLNYDSPRIINQVSDLKLADNPPFIKKVYAENQVMIKSDFSLQSGLKSIILESNRPVSFENIQVVYHTTPEIKSGVLTKVIMPFSGFALDKTNFKITLSKDSLLRQSIGYLSVENLKGLSNEFIPEVMIGYADFLRRVLKKSVPLMSEMKMDTVKKQINKDVETNMRRRFEIGLISGYALYNGTISAGSLLKNDLNSSFGLHFKYLVSKKYSANLSIQSFTLSGSDMNSNDTFKLKRGMSFKSPVISVGIQFFRDFKNNYTYKKNKIIPSVGFGFEYLKFNPTGQFLGKWYDLQSLGTGGQTLTGAKNTPYPLTTLGSVISAELNFFKSKTLVFAATFSYHFTYTNYLDDVGPDAYPSISAIENQGGANMVPLIYFSNPSGLLHGGKQLRSGSNDGFDNYASFNIRISRIF